MVLLCQRKHRFLVIFLFNRTIVDCLRAVAAMLTQFVVDTVDGRNPAPLGIFSNLVNNGIFTISTGVGIFSINSSSQDSLVVWVLQAYPQMDFQLLFSWACLR